MSHIITQLPKDDEIGRIIQKYFEGRYCEKFVLVGEDETCLPVYYEKFANDFQNFEVRDSDVFVCTYPKVGTTWTQEMVWLIMNDLDYEGAKAVLLTRFPFFEYSMTHDFEKVAEDMKTKPLDCVRDSIAYSGQKPNPRFIKTHLPFPLLPQQIQNGTKSPKIIYVIRDSRDACVSYFHHGKLLQGWRPNMEDFCKVFMTNKIMYGSFWKHVFGFWENRNLSNLLFITYEDMKYDHGTVIKKVANFLDKNLSEEEIKKLCHHLSFESMKKNDAVNGEAFVRAKREKKIIPEEGEFLRSGIVGKHKEELSPKLIEELNSWIKENISGTSLAAEYPYLM